MEPVMSAGVRSSDPALTMQLIERSARLARLQIALAVESGDEDGNAIAVAQLRWALATAEQLVAANHELVRQLERFRAQASTWLPREPLVLIGDASIVLLKRLSVERARLAGVADSEPSAPIIDATAAELVELDLDELDLSRIKLHAARLVDITARRAILAHADAT